MRVKHLLFLWLWVVVTALPNYTQVLPAVAAPNTSSGAQAELRIIDAHTHTKFEGGNNQFSGIKETEEQYLKEWQAANVVAAVAHTRADGGEYFPTTKFVTYCAGIGEKVDGKALEQGLKEGKYGCLKIYLGYNYFYASDKRYKKAYELAEKYDVPVVFHTGDTSTSRGKLKYSDPLTIDEVAVDWPKVKFVIAHAGYPWIQSAAEVAYKNPNVFIECSAFVIGDLSKKSAEYLETYAVKPIAWVFGYLEDPSKLMFGTDWPLTSMQPYVEIYKKAIPAEHWPAVFHDNAVRVFKIKSERPLAPPSVIPE
jgi:uncharacterized protein